MTGSGSVHAELCFWEGGVRGGEGGGAESARQALIAAVRRLRRVQKASARATRFQALAGVPERVLVNVARSPRRPLRKARQEACRHLMSPDLTQMLVLPRFTPAANKALRKQRSATAPEKGSRGSKKRPFLKEKEKEPLKQRLPAKSKLRVNTAELQSRDNPHKCTNTPSLQSKHSRERGSKAEL